MWDISPFFKSTQNITIERLDHGNVSYDSVSLLINLCSGLMTNGSLDECPKNSSICMVITNWKVGVPRIISIQGFELKEIDLDIEEEKGSLVVETKSGMGQIDLEFKCNDKATVAKS